MKAQLTHVYISGVPLLGAGETKGDGNTVQCGGNHY